jgi:hypothetical protein
VTEAELKKIINSGPVKYSDEELKQIIQLLKRLADIEYANYIKTKSNKKS